MSRHMFSSSRLYRLKGSKSITGFGKTVSLGHQGQCRYMQGPAWRSSSALDQYLAKAPRPISLRQLTFFGRNLTEERLLSSANYVRTELPTRIAHRIRDIQRLPYVVVTNPSLSQVYETYHRSFEKFRKTPEIKTTADNDKFCGMIKEGLKDNLSVIPNLARGVLECQDLVSAVELDTFMNVMLRSRISRRTIAEQHLALTETFNSPFFFPGGNDTHNQLPELYVGEVLMKCNAKDVIERCGRLTQDLSRRAHGSDAAVPSILLEGDLDATFPYIPSHLEYIIGELFRNSIEATIERHGKTGNLPPIYVLICNTQQDIIFRISDQGGGIPQDILPHIWSFSKGPRSQTRLQNFSRVPAMAATISELFDGESVLEENNCKRTALTSLAPLSHRPPDLKLGLGLPMSRVYAEYWAGTLKLHSLDGYGTDFFLSISKLGNKAEQLNVDGV